MAKNLKFCELLEQYGLLLTPRQLDIMSCYYFEDFSLSEIGDNLEIDRQTVKTVIKRAENVLLKYEDKLHLTDRFKRICQLSEVAKTAENKDLQIILNKIIGFAKENTVTGGIEEEV
ncbi:MAG: DNA-binding protein [Oscillospiraceae bacterium]|nr:DNA-binding protein [Oscillospiraceae bacterium]